ncbi:MAG TPA: phosphate ABC transporter permease subunit PstC [Williamwhitmania sp.]|nr:phosphate ABC transporter permease subunit PstC [Williamwhitmania sp.]
MLQQVHSNANIRSLNFREAAFRKTLSLSAILLIVLLISIFLTLLVSSLPSIQAIGLKFLYQKVWDPVANEFGALPFLAGTLMTSALAILISTPFALAIGLFLGEYYPRGWISGLIKNAVELLAGIPSVILGFWGIFTIVPIVRAIEMRMGAVPSGVGILAASIILAIMITPFSASLIRLVISMVPLHLKEAAYALGATRFEVVRFVIIPYIRSGMSAGILLALGRALGETMAVTMLIGNTQIIPKSIFDTGNTMASVIANEFTEATGKIYFSALIETGLVLFVVTTIINIIGVRIIKRFEN